MPRYLSTVLSITAVAAVAVAAVSTLRERPTQQSTPPAPATARVESVDVHSSIAPDRGNVSHEFRAEVAALEARLNDAPDDTLALARLGALLHMAHQPAEAVTHLERYTAISPGNREAWLQLATSYGALDEWDKALDVMMGMLARWPDDPEVMYNVGAIHANQGAHEEARRWWENVRDQQINPAVADAATASLRRLPTTRP